MNENEIQTSTVELWAKLFQSPTLDAWMAETNAGGELPAFSDYITMLAENKDEKPAKIIERGKIGKSMGHSLFRGDRHPSRDTALQLAFGFMLSPGETQDLLKIARMSPLHPKVKRDAIIVHCLYRNTGIEELNMLLFKNGLPLLGDKPAE